MSLSNQIIFNPLWFKRIAPKLFSVSPFPNTPTLGYLDKVCWPGSIKCFC